MIILNPIKHFCFIDTMQALQNEFKNDISTDVLILDVANTSKKYDVAYFRKKYPKSKIIAFNQEPLLAEQHQFMHKLFFKFLKDVDEVWDYDERQVDVIKTINSNTQLHILKPYKNWNKYSPVNKDIDILFYGTINEHRKKLLDELKKRYKVIICNGVHGDNLDSFILRSKILLNIHFYYECASQEQARMIRWIGAPCKIISEKSYKNYLNVDEMTYEELLKL
jgi:hypothetical protein